MTIKCIIENIIYTPSTSKKVFKAKNKSNKISFYCVGNIENVEEGQHLELVGEFNQHNEYGRAFYFEKALIDVVNSNNIAKFLNENVKGIGTIFATKIVEMFGENTIEVLRGNIDEIPHIKGISHSKLAQIHEQIEEIGDEELEALQFYIEAKISPFKRRVIEEAFSDCSYTPIEIVEQIKENPYCLIDIVKGIGFKSADAIALNIGYDRCGERRIRAGLVYALKEEVDQKGNVWINRKSLIIKASNKNCLGVQQKIVEPILDKMIEEEGYIKACGERVYLFHYYSLERTLAYELIRIKHQTSLSLSPYNMQMLDQKIRKIEELKGRTLDEGQREAIKVSTKNNLSIITGGPGVGKTTTLDILLTLLEKEFGFHVTLAAPTGRAAKRMSEQTQREARTIHSLYLERKTSNEVIGKEVLVIDEASMIDMDVLQMTLEICDNTKLIFVGDKDQLPSIGAGQILKDMINSNVIATSKLTTIHRQGSDSHIISNAHLVLNGKHLDKAPSKDFALVEQNSEQNCLKLLQKYIQTLPKTLRISIDDVQILTPLNKGILGTLNLNNVLQSAINPPSPSKNEYKMINAGGIEICLREGDRVIQNKNDYEVISNYGPREVFNGEIGTISKIYNETIYVKYQDKEIIYNNKNVKNISLAYAITIHRSQGSEFKMVILPLFTYSIPSIFNRNLLYTAITRAKSYCCIVGKRETTNKMIHNNQVTKRQTTLLEFLKEMENNYELSKLT